MINQKQELPTAAIFNRDLTDMSQSKQRTLYMCFLSTFGSFGKSVAEEKIKMLKVNRQPTTDDVRQMMAKVNGHVS